jgi:hypothetical protein
MINDGMIVNGNSEKDVTWRMGGMGMHGNYGRND